MTINTGGPHTTQNVFIKTASVEESGKLFSDELASIFQWITFSILNQVVAVFGVGSNIVNIICFVKQGFKDPVNISFLGLAVADLCCLLTIMWTNLCLNPAFMAADLPFESVEFQHLASAMPHFTFIRVSSCITALITMERCLCIIAPIKVKSLVTSKRVTVIIVCVFVINLAISAPIYAVNRLGWKYFPDKNKTLIGMLFMGDRELVETISYIINNACIPFGAFLVTIIATIILVIQLQKKAKWRKESTVSAQADNVSTRNEKVAKMVIMISVLFIFCFTPISAFFIAMSAVPSISMAQKDRNVILIFAGFGNFLESLNSAVNIFIYYDMSSKYKSVLRQLLCIRWCINGHNYVKGSLNSQHSIQHNS